MATSKCDYLIIVTTDIEELNLLRAASTLHSVKAIQMNGHTFYDLGRFYRGTVYATRSNMASDTPGGSGAKTAISINHLNPKSILLIGIAFGINKPRQPIGSILISEGIWGYDFKKIGTCEFCGGQRVDFRADPVYSTKTLYEYFKNYSHIHPSGYIINPGFLFSGQTLIDNIDYKKHIFRNRPSSKLFVGGEMEGAGFYASCNEFEADWIIIKAVCDYADGHKNNSNKDKNQHTAAKAAVEFILGALNYKGRIV